LSHILAKESPFCVSSTETGIASDKEAWRICRKSEIGLRRIWQPTAWNFPPPTIFLLDIATGRKLHYADGSSLPDGSVQSDLAAALIGKDLPMIRRGAIRCVVFWRQRKHAG